MMRGVRGGVVLVRVGALAGLVWVGACVHTEAERVVATQGAANAGVLAANIATLAGAVRESARVECEVVVRRARERVAGELVRIRGMIVAASPTEAGVMDAGAPWVKAVEREVEGVRERVMGAPVGERERVARAIAEECAASVDVAVGTPGFTVGRVVRDAVEIDRVNEMVEAEENATVRAGLSARRDAIVDGYLAVRVAAEGTGRYREGVERYLAAVGEQVRVAGLQAEAMRSATNGGDVRRAVGGVIGDRDVRAAVLGIVAREWGEGVAADVRERIERVRSVVEGR